MAKKKKTPRRVGSVILFILSLLTAIFLFASEYIGYDLSPLYQVMLFILSSALAVVGERIQMKIQSRKNRDKGMKTILSLILVMYALLLIKYTVFDGYYGRNISKIGALSVEKIREHMKTRCNLVPFSTIDLMFNGYENGDLSKKNLLVNIAGNLAAFMPTALLLPLISDRQKRILPYFLTVSASIIAVEITQVVLTVGSGDIDDYILNIVGALVLYMILHIKPIGTLAEKCFRLDYFRRKKQKNRQGNNR